MPEPGPRQRADVRGEVYLPPALLPLEQIKGDVCRALADYVLLEDPPELPERKQISMKELRGWLARADDPEEVCRELERAEHCERGALLLTPDQEAEYISRVDPGLARKLDEARNSGPLTLTDVGSMSDPAIRCRGMEGAAWPMALSRLSAACRHWNKGTGLADIFTEGTAPSRTRACLVRSTVSFPSSHTCTSACTAHIAASRTKRRQDWEH